MFRLGLALALYIVASVALFLFSAFTINAWIVYGLFTLPFYAIIVLASWAFIWKNRQKSFRFPYRIWATCLLLQAMTVLASPGNCAGTKQGERCYSNLQILLTDVPRTGFTNIPHWYWVEDAFLGLLGAYSIMLVLSLVKTSVVDRQHVESDQ